ncbi:TetR/AcrR family transcriptional regulator [Bradyrhizobium canariense]|uniref:Transcriptional regulator, TetR family n=1 Tax=Bradyrhizobium canariense TaxID=255045 RepID=A0A1H2AZD1_9BRAD|nr:TetR/AcrR family transcriptional regulator [Bradyrhizobium canariense]SDT51318.1 transcriptional regulator, TetR family [Bradyrhizobium canariense]
MRYEKGHKDATRQRIIDVASRQFRENGVAAVGIAGIMTDAGLTNGAFYSHFKSKEDLVRTVLSNALRGREETLRTGLKTNAGLEVMIRDYLSPAHRDRPSGGCPTAALVAEVARHPKATRDAFTGKISAFISLIATQIRKGSAARRRRDAVAIYGMMVGTLQLARAVNDKQLSDEILESGISAALALAGDNAA